MALNDLNIVQRSLASRRFSTVTTILTVAIAVALLLVLLSLRDSGRQTMMRGTGNMHFVASRDTSPLMTVMNLVFYANPPTRAIEWEAYEELAGSYPWAYAIPTQQGDSYRGLPVVATTGEFYTDFQPRPDQPWSMAEGRWFETQFEVVLGHEAAQRTGLRIGDGIHLTHGMDVSRQYRQAAPDADIVDPHVHYEYEYRVVGILQPTGSAHDRALYTDLESTWIIHAHDVRRAEDPSVERTTVDDLRDSDRLITGVLLRVMTRPGADGTAVMQQIFNELRSDPTLTVASPPDQIRRLLQIIGNIDQIFIAMGAVVLVSSAIAIMLALYNSMEQRRRQIAVLRVLGCSQGRLFGLIITESAVLGLFGAAVGVVIAFLGMQVVVDLVDREFGLVIEPVLGVRLGLTVVLATVFLSALAGVVPAASAYRTPVVENLRPLG